MESRKAKGPEVAPTEKTAKRASYIVIYLVMLMLALAIQLRFGEDHLAEGDGVSIVFLIVLIFGIVAGIFMLWRIPQSRLKLTFMAPCLPLLPCTAICVNLFLMLRLHPDAWKRLAIWVAAGCAMYFGYGMMHSRKETKGAVKVATPVENGGFYEQNGGKLIQQNGHVGYDATMTTTTTTGYDYDGSNESPFQPAAEPPLPPGPFQRANVQGQAYSYDINY